MLNQTGQVDRHIFPHSLTLPSRSSVPRSRFFSCPSSPPSLDYGCAVPAFESVPSVPLQKDYFVEEVPEYFDEFPTEETPYARDPILDRVSTGLEAEALIKKYGGDLFTPVELAPMAATQPASFFRESLPTSSGIELPPDFSREIDRVSVANNDWSVSLAILYLNLQVHFATFFEN